MMVPDPAWSTVTCYGRVRGSVPARKRCLWGSLPCEGCRIQKVKKYIHSVATDEVTESGITCKSRFMNQNIHSSD